MKFLKKFKWVIIITALFIGFLVSISITSKRSEVGLLENSIAAPINAVQGVVYKGTSKIKGFFGFIKNFNDVKEENEQLKKKNEELEKKLDDFKEIERRYKEFEKMFKFKSSKSQFDYIGCEIVGISGNNYMNGFILNKGSNDGIEKRMVAITADGLVGQITSVGSNWSSVQTLANDNIAVAGYVERTSQINGIVRGYKSDDNKILARIELPTPELGLQVGDVIMTSGLGEIYPKGIKIGEVIEVYEDKSKVIKYGIIDPYVNINTLNEIFIVKPKEERKIQD